MFVSSPRRCYSPVLCPKRTSTHVPSAQRLSHGVDLLTASLPVRFFFLKADYQDPGCYFHFVLIPEQLSHRDKSRLFLSFTRGNETKFTLISGKTNDGNPSHVTTDGLQKQEVTLLSWCLHSLRKKCWDISVEILHDRSESFMCQHKGKVLIMQNNEGFIIQDYK